MKLSTGVFLLFFSIGSTGWQTSVVYGKEKIVDFLSNPIRRSRVPQFILDAQNPWILENRGKLERLPDAESFLCSLTQLSARDPSESGLDVPPDLFEYLEIDNNRVGVDRPGWPNAALRLQEIHRCPAALSQVKTFNTVIWAHRSEWSDWNKRILEPQQVPAEALDLFADVLGNMTNLETLRWNIPPSDAPYIEEHFAKRGLVLPSVRRLEPGIVSPFLVRTCPSITVLEEERHIMEPEQFLQAAMLAPNLTRFAITVRNGWDLSLVQDLVSLYLPSIESLGLWGELWPRYRYGSRMSSNETALGETLRLLQSLKNLTHLDLPPAYGLDLGWDGGPMCGNAYMGPGGRETERWVWRDSAETIDKAASLVVELLPRLTGFSIGGTTPNLTRYENGTLRATFSWTGRINEWVMENLPLEPDESDGESAFTRAQLRGED